MKVPAIFQRESRTRLLQGIAFGAVATMTIGLIWGGWVTEEGARIMRAAAENSGRMSVLVPLCVAQFTATDGAMARFKHRLFQRKPRQRRREKRRIRFEHTFRMQFARGEIEDGVVELTML